MKNLYERISDDVDAHEKANTAYHLLADYIKHGGKADFHFECDPSYGEDAGDYYGIKPESIGFDREFGLTDALVFFGLRKRSSAIMAGGTWTFKTTMAGHYRRAIVIHCLRSFTDAEFKDAPNTTAFVQTFMHEFIHVLDQQRTNDKIIGPQVDPSDKERYYNDASERNAYFHTVADTWLECLRYARRHPEGASDYAMLANISGDFAQDLTNLIGRTLAGKRFIQYLSMPNQKALMKRLYRLHKEMMDGLNSLVK